MQYLGQMVNRSCETETGVMINKHCLFQPRMSICTPFEDLMHHDLRNRLETYCKSVVGLPFVRNRGIVMYLTWLQFPMRSPWRSISIQTRQTVCSEQRSTTDIEIPTRLVSLLNQSSYISVSVAYVSYHQTSLFIDNLETGLLGSMTVSHTDFICASRITSCNHE
jgi:hypothetical protein